jgi:hypothetical protein
LKLPVTSDCLWPSVGVRGRQLPGAPPMDEEIRMSRRLPFGPAFAKATLFFQSNQSRAGRPTESEMLPDDELCHPTIRLVGDSSPKSRIQIESVELLVDDGI